jgi:broad specificity phosphatase PhoE
MSEFLLIRHAQSHWNVWKQQLVAAGDSASAAQRHDPCLFDATITPDIGHQQARQLRQELHKERCGRAPDLILCSPLSRAVQTALGVFGQEDSLDSGVAWSYESRCRSSSIATTNNHTSTAPIVLLAELREHVEDSCDIGSSASVLHDRFPALRHAINQAALLDDWYLPAHLRSLPHDSPLNQPHASSDTTAPSTDDEQSLDDKIHQQQQQQQQHWRLVSSDDGRESEREIEQRVAHVRNLLVQLDGKYQCIAIVGHGNFFWRLTGREIDVGQGVREVFGVYLQNCEVHSYSLPLPTTNHKEMQC